MTEALRSENENQHHGELKIAWPDPQMEPAWHDRRVRAIALELAIKTADEWSATPGRTVVGLGEVGDQILVLAERYRTFVAGDSDV
jgi:hypothetical protein